MKPKLLVFASGTKIDGGTGFKKLVEASRGGALDAEIVGVVSNYDEGGVAEKAKELGIPFIHFLKPWIGPEYQRIADESGADYFPLSGWMKLVSGLDPRTRFNAKTVFNIHPGPLPDFGGPDLYGHKVHEAVLAGGYLYKRKDEKHLADAEKFGFDNIEVIINNFYPFESTVAKAGVTFDAAIENIDIGGPGTVRAGAKNHESVTVIIDPADYEKVASEFKANGNTSYDTRLYLAQKVYAKTASYDAAIAVYLANVIAERQRFATANS